MGGHRVAPRPTLFGMTPLGFVNWSTYRPNSLERVAGTGSAFILIHRDVLYQMRSKYGPVWYDPITPSGGRPISEDLSFCYRVGDVGIPIHVHTGIKTTHHKELWLAESDYPMPDRDPVFRGQ